MISFWYSCVINSTLYYYCFCIFFWHCRGYCYFAKCKKLIYQIWSFNYQKEIYFLLDFTHL